MGDSIRLTERYNSPPKTVPAGEGGDMRTSVVIPAYRAWSTLPVVLDALAPQVAGGEREVVLVDSGGISPSYPAERWPWLRVVACPSRLLPGEARNLGAAHARGELLAFLDADAVPARDWLDRLEEALTVEVDAVAGTTLNGTPHSRIGTAEYLLTFSETWPRRPRPLRHAPSVGLLIRRTCFEAVGGFAEGLRAGEDTVLTFPLASNGRLAFTADAAVRHMNRTRLKPFLANQRLQGAARVAACKLVAYPDGWVCRGPALLIAGPLRLIALLRFLLRNPVEARQALGALPELLMGTGAWVIGAFEASRRCG